MDEDILAPEQAAKNNYKETDIFEWSNNLVQYKDDLKIDLFLFNKNYVAYKTSLGKDLNKQLEPLFIDNILEYVLEGVETGLTVRGFEEAESEDGVLQRTQLFKVEKARELLNWIKTQEHELEVFNDEEHDFSRIKGIVARVRHENAKHQVYVVKILPKSNVMRGKTGWMMRGDKFVPFDADAALRIPADNHLLIIDQDIYVFSQSRLKQLFGYDAKEAMIAERKVKEILEHFKLSFPVGLTMQNLVANKPSTIKKLQKIEPSIVKQDELIDHGEEIGVELMEDEEGAIIIMDDKDLTKFVNLLNDDYVESGMTGQRYEIIKKRPLKPPQDDEIGGMG